MKVKICGIQHIKDAQFAIAASADYIGFIFDSNSKRAIDKSVAKKIIEKVRGKVEIVGVFRNNMLEEVNSLSDELNFDLVQLHGEEDPVFCHKVSRPVIKTFGLPVNFSVKDTIKKMKKYNVRYYLIDREQPGVGETLSLERSDELIKLFPIFFAGGLTPENVSEVAREIKPFAVDVITGVKTDGKFDFEKMKQFVINAKGATL